MSDPNSDFIAQVEAELAAMPWPIADFLEAARPFLWAAAVGHCVEADVDAAKPDQHTERPLIAFAGYAGHYAAQSRVSWADWKRLLDAADRAGLLEARPPA